MPKQSDPYRKAQKRLEELSADLRKDGQIRPSQECVMLIKHFWDGWETKALGSLGDAIAVFARRNNVGFTPVSMERALAEALIGDSSTRAKRTASEWAKVLKSTRDMPPERTHAVIQGAGGIDALAKNGIKPREVYLFNKERMAAKAKPDRS